MLRQGFFNSVFRGKPVNINNGPVPVNINNGPVPVNTNFSNPHAQNPNPNMQSNPYMQAQTNINTQTNPYMQAQTSPNMHNANYNSNANANYNSNANANYNSTDVNWRLYMTLFMNPRLNTLSQAQFHFTVNCLPNNSTYKMYYRTFYKIPLIFNEESYIAYLEKADKKKHMFNQYKDLYKYFIDQGAVLDDTYFRGHYNIPDDFSLETYNKRYALKYTKEQTNDAYNFYSTSGYPLDDMYYRLHYNIPADFELDSYNKYTNSTFTSKDAYKKYSQNGKPLDDAYYLVFYAIPTDFLGPAYTKRYELSYTTEQFKDLCLFYSKNHLEKPLDDTYYRVLYNIPTEFALDVYNKRYGYTFTAEQTNAAYQFFTEKNISLDEDYYQAYYNIPADFSGPAYTKRYELPYTTEQFKEILNFYSKNHLEKPLDDTYYRILYGIPTDFALDAYNKRYGYTFTSEQTKEAYKCFSEKNLPLDEDYLKLHFHITDTKFDWTAYLHAYSDAYFKEEDTRINVYRHFGKKEYKNLSTINEPYYRKLYNLPKNFSIENYISATPFLFNDDYYHALDVYSNKILLHDIYEDTMKKTDKSLKEIKFLENYDYLQKFPEISSEKDKKYFIHLKDFVEMYYENNTLERPVYKEIEEIRTISNIEQITEVKRVKNKNYVKKNIEISQMESLSKIIAMASKFGIGSDKLGIPIPSQEIVLSNPNAPVPVVIPQSIEPEFIDVTEIKDVEVTKEIKNIRLERYYDTLYFKLADKQTVLRQIKSVAKNLYNVFTFKYQTDNIRNFENYFSENVSDKNAIFYTFNNYPHTSIVFRNNIVKLGMGWSHTVICCLSNERKIKEMCQEISKHIQVIVLPYQYITYNEWNNTLLKKTFWSEQILGETLIMYNENIFFLEGLPITTLTSNECVGYELPRIFTYNNSLNGYSDISFRKKSLMLETLHQLHTIQINNCLCKEIQTHFHLDNMPEDILYSYFIFNVRTTKKEEDYLEKMKTAVDLLTKNINIINYKFSNLEKCSLKQYITEFIKMK
jgi:hypothetical protein